MKDIENIVATEEESLNETSGSRPERERGRRFPLHAFSTWAAKIAMATLDRLGLCT